MTVGAFAAHSLKFKDGGLRRQLRSLHENVMSSDATRALLSRVNRFDVGENLLETINGLQNDMRRLRVKIDECCDATCRNAVQSKASGLREAAQALSDNVCYTSIPYHQTVI